MSVSKKLRLVFLKQTLFAGKTGKTELPFPTFTLYRSQYWKHMFDKFWNRDFLWWPRRFWITKAELLFPPFNLYRSQYWENMFDRFWNKKWSLTSDVEIIFQNLWLKETLSGFMCFCFPLKTAFFLYIWLENSVTKRKKDE